MRNMTTGNINLSLLMSVLSESFVVVVLPDTVLIEIFMQCYNPLYLF